MYHPFPSSDNEQNKKMKPSLEQVEVELRSGEGLSWKNTNDCLELKVMKGNINIFGTEFIESESVTFPKGRESFCLNMGDLSLLQVSHASGDSISKVAEASSVKFMKNVFELFDSMTKDTNHVRLLIVGPTDTGKSTLSKILFNHAWFSQQKRVCFFSDVDVGQNQVSLPGTMNLVHVAPTEGDLPLYSKTVSVVNETPLGLIHKNVYNFGDISPKSSIYYDLICGNIYKMYKQILDANKTHADASFWITNTCGWVEGPGYTIIKNAIKSMNITHVLCLDGQTKTNLERDVKGVKILFLEKSSHVKKRSTNFRKETRNNTIAHHFSNRSNTVTLPITDIKMYMIDYKTQNTAVSYFMNLF